MSHKSIEHEKFFRENDKISNKFDFINDDDNYYTLITNYLWFVEINDHIHVFHIWKNNSHNNISIK